MSAAYIAQMVEYYDGAKYGSDWDQVRRSYVDDDAHMKPELGRLMGKLQQTFKGRRVLELAAGGGRWTRYLAVTAESVLATDTSAQILKIGRELVPAANVQFRRCDAFELGDLAGPFDGAFHFNFINHLPYGSWPRLLEQVHGKLTPGAVVVMGGQLYRGPQSDGGDFYGERGCSNGKRYKLIDNWPEPEQVQDLIGHLARDIEFEIDCGWWVKYRVP